MPAIARRTDPAARNHSPRRHRQKRDELTMDVPSKTFIVALICAGVSLMTGLSAGAAALRAGGIGGAVHGGFGVGHIGVGGIGGFRNTVGGGTFRGRPAGGAIAANPFGGGWREGEWRGDRDRRHGFGLGFATGALVGTALPAPWWDDDYYAYAPYPYVPAYYEYDDYAWDRPDVRYCEMRFKSYDPVTGTYLGYDGRRHSCP
jgi:BA14K-like protein